MAKHLLSEPQGSRRAMPVFFMERKAAVKLCDYMVNIMPQPPEHYEQAAKVASDSSSNFRGW